MQELNIHRLQTQVNIEQDEREYHLPIASATQLGGIKVGENLSIEEDGTLNAEATEYELPTASASTLGGIKVGSGLQINNGVLTPIVDTILSTVSANPVTNATISNTINTINSDITGLGSRVGVLETSNGNILNSISGIEGSITSINGAVDTLDSNLSSLSSTVSGFSSAISQNTSDISSLGGRMTTAEGKITTLEGTATSLTQLVDDEQTYSYLLPVSTWTAGTITLERRGKVGTLYIDIEGDLTLASAASTIVFSYDSLNLFLPASAALVSDDGLVLGKVDDQTNNFTLENISGSSLHITKVKGSIPLVFF